jgi:uncharacterized protein (UPF0333 family)
MNNKSQVSMEYIMIAAFSLMVAIPLVVLFFTSSRDYNEEVAISQANKVVDEIMSASKQVYYLGEPSKKTITVYFPQSIHGINITDINGKGIIDFYMRPAGTIVTVRRTAVFNISGNLSTYPGTHVITIKAENNTIFIK